MLSEPAVGKNFFGRDDLLQILAKRVETLKDGYRQNVAITGQSLAGKSSLLQHFLYTVRDDSFIPVYVEIGRETLSSFANKFIATLLYNSLRSKGAQTARDISGLLEKADGILPKTTQAIRQILSQIEKRQLTEAYANLLGLTSTLKDETARSCIVILDEFHNIESFDIKNPFSTFGKVIMLQRDTMYIVSSSKLAAIKKILQEKLALLFGNFEIIEMKGFDARRSSGFIDWKLSPITIDADLKKFLIAFTGGNPFYLDCLAVELKRIAQGVSQEAATQETMEEALLRLIYNSNGTIHQYLLNYLLDSLDMKNRDSYIDLLIVIAKGVNRLRDIPRTVKKNSSEVSRMLGRLTEAGLISKQGVFYIIEDRMLCFWLKHVYHRKQTILINNVLEKTYFYREDIKGHISLFLRDVSQTLIARVAELFNLFSNDLMQQEDKAILLPQFTRVALDTFDDLRPHITAMSKNKCWVSRIYTAPVLEDDIADCVRHIRSLQQKIGRFVVIPLAGIDDNAKLLAKELKFSLWDIEFVNTLLYIYGRNAIVFLSAFAENPAHGRG